MPEGNTLLVLLVILALGLVVPAITHKARLPFVTTLILLGAIMGPHGLGAVEANPVIDFFGFLGFTLLMFMAGIQTKLGEFSNSWRKIGLLAFCNGGILFLFGMAVARHFGYGWTTALLLGTIFISSSIGIAIPLVKDLKLFERVDGRRMIATIFLIDAVSLVLLAMIFQSVEPSALFPLPVHFGILALSLLALKFLLPRAARYFLKRAWSEKAEHEDQLRFVIVTLFVVLSFFELLGVHPILAAFVTGLLLSDIVTSRHILEKLHVLAYGLFIPVFFFVIGMEMDLALLTSFDAQNLLLAIVVAGVIISKFVTGLVGGVAIGMHPRNAAIFGTLTSVQLTTTLAATYGAAALGLLDEALVTAILTLSIVTTFAAPVAARAIAVRFVLPKGR